LCSPTLQEDAIFIGANPSHSHLVGNYCVTFDPLDGSSNIDAGVNVGTIFGIYKIKEGSKGTLEDVLRPGREMVAAGYTMYGSSCNVSFLSGPGGFDTRKQLTLLSSSLQLVLSTGQGVNGFTLDESLGEFILTHPEITIPKRGKIYSFNEGNSKYFHEPTLKYRE